MKAVKTIAALIFVSAFAIVLVQPVLDASDRPGRRVEHRFGERGNGEGDDGMAVDEGDGRERVRLTARYPKRCIRRSRTAGSGLVAARRGSIADIGFADEAPAARIGVSGDVAWSASGRFLAERGGRVFDRRGNPQGALFFEPREWQWSPVADCALATTQKGSLTFGIPGSARKGIRLLNAPVVDFELSPNGRRLAAVVEDRGLWIADLRGGRIVRATRGRASLVGWFSNRSVLFSKSTGSGKLRYATAGGRTRIVRGALAGGTLVRCASRTLLVAPDVDTNVPLAELTGRGGRIDMQPLAGSPSVGAGYTGASCSPDGAFVAASTLRWRGAKGRLVLLRADGTVLRELAGGRTANPTWSDEGLMFVRFGKAGRGRLWLIEPGAATPARTAYRVGAPTQYDWHVR